MTGKDGRSGGATSLFLIDDHPVVGLGLALALQGHGHFRLVGTATNRFAGLTTIERLRPDALVVDLVFDGEAQTAFLRECRSLLPAAMIVVFSSLPQRIYEREAIEMGADAYVGKNSDLADLVERLTQIAARPHQAHIAAVPARMAAAIPVPPAPALPGEMPGLVIDGVYLTQREGDVARRLGEGLSVTRIADDLHISPNTASVHRDNIRKKLKCRDMTELVALLARNRIRGEGRP